MNISKEWEQKYALQSDIIKAELKMLINGHVDEGSLFAFEQELKKNIKLHNTFLLKLLSEQII